MATCMAHFAMRAGHNKVEPGTGMWYQGQQNNAAALHGSRSDGHAEDIGNKGRVAPPKQA